MALEVKQGSEPQGSGWWKWHVDLHGTDDELADIARVVYHLHSTFAEPVQIRTDQRGNFRLAMSGWGTFTIAIEVVRDEYFAVSVGRRGHRPKRRRESSSDLPCHQSERKWPLGVEQVDEPIPGEVRDNGERDLRLLDLLLMIEPI